MAVHYEHIGFNEDGSPRFHITSDSGHVVMTGPIIGPITVDGVQVDVSAPFIEAADEAQAVAISDAIGERLVAEGHPDFVADPEKDSFGFVHTPSTGGAFINAAASDDAVAAAAEQLGVPVDDITRVGG